MKNLKILTGAILTLAFATGALAGGVDCYWLKIDPVLEADFFDAQMAGCLGRDDLTEVNVFERHSLLEVDLREAYDVADGGTGRTVITEWDPVLDADFLGN